MGLAGFAYFKALSGDKIENITPFFQAIPIFTYVFAGIILKEALAPISIVLMIAIILISGVFMWNVHTKKTNWNGIFRMLLSSLCYSLFYVGFKF
jgi:uncharacterized membrane protein